MWEVAEELQHQPLYDHCTFEAKWKGEKAWQVGASQADQESKKSSLWSVVFTYSTQQQQTISLLDCDMWQKEDFTMTSLVTGLRRRSQVLPKAKLVPKKKVMVTVWWSAAGLIPYSFLNPDKTITNLRSILSKSRKCTENCNACSQHWSPERGQFCITTSDRTLYNQCFKSWMNWATKFCFIHHFTWPLTNRLPLL